MWDRTRFHLRPYYWTFPKEDKRRYSMPKLLDDEYDQESPLIVIKKQNLLRSPSDSSLLYLSQLGTFTNLYNTYLISIIYNYISNGIWAYFAIFTWPLYNMPKVLWAYWIYVMTICPKYFGHIVFMLWQYAQTSIILLLMIFTRI